jgi:hypothetical protein
MKLLDNFWEETYLKSLFNKLKNVNQYNKECVETRIIEKTFNVFKKESNISFM